MIEEAVPTAFFLVSARFPAPFSTCPTAVCDPTPGGSGRYEPRSACQKAHRFNDVDEHDESAHVFILLPSHGRSLSGRIFHDAHTLLFYPISSRVHTRQPHLVFFFTHVLLTCRYTCIRTVVQDQSRASCQKIQAIQVPVLLVSHLRDPTVFGQLEEPSK